MKKKKLKFLNVLIVGILTSILLGSCKKKATDSELEVAVVPSKITILNVASEYSCKDLNTADPPSKGSLAGPVFNIIKLTMHWKNPNRKLQIIGFRFVFNDNALSAKYDQVMPLEEMTSIHPLTRDSFIYCDWCYFEAYDSTSQATQDKTKVVLEDGKKFDLYNDGSTGQYQVCGPRMGGVNVKTNIATQTTISGYLVIQGLTTSKGDSGDVQNYYQIVPLSLLYQPPPL